jgi:hypothetical protein
MVSYTNFIFDKNKHFFFLLIGSNWR